MESRLCAPEAALVHSAARVEGVLDGWPADGGESAGGEAPHARGRGGLAAPVPRLRLESVSLFHFLVFDVDDLHEFPFERSDQLPVFVQDFVRLRFDPLLHLPLELPLLALDAAGPVAAVGIEDLEQVLDFDVLEVLWREVLENLRELVQQKILESRVCFDFFNPVLKEKIKIGSDLFVFISSGNQRGKSLLSILDNKQFWSSTNFEKKKLAGRQNYSLRERMMKLTLSG